MSNAVDIGRQVLATNTGLFLAVRSFRLHWMLNVGFVQAPVGREVSRPIRPVVVGQILFSGSVAAL